MPFNFRLPNHRYARRVAPGTLAPREPGQAYAHVQGAALPVWMARLAAPVLQRGSPTKI